MSYILDALRKADRERKLGKTPRPEEVAGTEAPADARRLWPWLLCANAVLLLGLLLWLLLSSGDPPGDRETTVAAVVETAAEGAPEDTVTTQAAEAQATDAEDRSPLGPPVADVSEFDDFELPEPLSGQQPESESQARPSAGDAPSIEAAMAPDVVAEPEPAPAVTKPVTRPPPKPAAETLQQLREMPSDFRREVPDLRINTHFYSEQASRRFVLINLQKYREGDRLDEGPEVIAIRPDGVELAYRGERFLLPR